MQSKTSSCRPVVCRRGKSIRASLVRSRLYMSTDIIYTDVIEGGNTYYDRDIISHYTIWSNESK
jgi:hypothetical protein